MRKPAKASSLLKRLIIGIFSIIFLIGVLSFIGNQSKVLVISHQETGEIYAISKIQPGDKVTYEWIHSFEHIPWYEDFYVTDAGSLQLEEIRVAGFGAGIPEDKGTMSVENGMVYMRDLGDMFDHIQWFNSHTALQYIAINDSILIQGSEMPHHEPLKLEIKGRITQWLNH
ncbi:DUF1850 domain-containing protein [Fusibacter paucivorans]|uniref:DUF1850 domain-containing protein n=1 Tax=Fusibacter paucivorans TaxID=76009 RepID=A0ABS5PTX1_9FIRM|nr:DUF1850 domain-containing protein [Fusibacter paucivorans]MBS7528610.1 DUF1850 domain-containing protein [Fusibacter paucivorans]